MLNVEREMLNEETDSDPNRIQHSTLNIQHSSSYWRRLYAIVLAELAVTILIFYAFTKLFE
jgi:hypothetical protein